MYTGLSFFLSQILKSLSFPYSVPKCEENMHSTRSPSFSFVPSEKQEHQIIHMNVSFFSFPCYVVTRAAIVASSECPIPRKSALLLLPSLGAMSHASFFLQFSKDKGRPGAQPTLTTKSGLYGLSMAFPRHSLRPNLAMNTCIASLTRRNKHGGCMTTTARKVSKLGQGTILEDKISLSMHERTAIAVNTARTISGPTTSILESILVANAHAVFDLRTIRRRRRFSLNASGSSPPFTREESSREFSNFCLSPSWENQRKKWSPAPSPFFFF
ncbi:hypothetical protein VNO77_34795 [Canavalia gladiata]|uniref:Uncharacterized protein n=1 Tax=Canavalia gladiata TaxID=3824 RepID=A0AAN9KGW1_CANGL